MPIYEYACEICGHEFELTRKMADMKREESCPVCKDSARLKVSVGFTHGDEAPWINDELRGTLQPEGEARTKPITTRSEHKKYLKDNDIVER